MVVLNIFWLWVLKNWFTSTNLSNHYFFPFLEKICVLYIVGESSVVKISKFTLETFQKCKDILKIRSQRKLKYSNVKLPQDLSDVLGYHIDRYWKFTALGKTDRKQLKSLQLQLKDAEVVQILTSYHHILEFFNENVYFINNRKRKLKSKNKSWFK